jgi:predicted MFS family arabinose efflux permease
VSAVQAAPPRSTTTIILLSCAAFFSGAALRICDSLLPRLAHDFGLTPGAAGRVIISFSIAYGLMQLLFGPLGDRYGKARLVCVALFGCTAGSLACALAPSFDTLVLARVAWGMAAAGVIPLAWPDAMPPWAAPATLATSHRSCRMMAATGRRLFGDAALGWRGAFFTLSAGLLVALRYCSLAQHAVTPHPRARFRRTVAVRPVCALGPHGTGTVMAEGMFLLGPMAPALLLHQRHGLRSVASALIALYAVGGLPAITARRFAVASAGWRAGAR